MKKTKKMLAILILMTIIFITFNNIILAATTGSFSIKASSSSLDIGNTTSLTISVSNCEGRFSISSSNSNVVSVSSSSEWVDSNGKTIILTAKSAGTATITVTATDVADDQTDPEEVTGSKTVTITVKEKETTPPSTGGDNTGGSTGGSTGGTTGGTTGTITPTPDPTPVTPNFVSASGKVYATTDLNLRSSWSTSSSAVRVLKGTELTLTGTSTEKVNGYVWYRVSYNGQTKYAVKDYLTTTKPEEEKPEEQPTTPEEPETIEKSSNTNLKALTTNISGLTPEFSKDVKEYTLTVGADVENIVVTALAEDEKSKVEISGNEGLKVGENLIKVTVTAEDGTTTIYEIKVTKTEKAQLKLSKLEIAGYTLSPEFDPNIFEYTLRVSEIDKLDIEAIANDEKATVEIIGNSELVDGENLLTIIVKSEDGTQTVTYTITVSKGALQTVQYADDNNDMDKIITIAIIALAVLIILIIIILIIRKTRSNNIIEDDEEDNYDEEVYNSNNNKEMRNPFLEEMSNDFFDDEKPKNKRGKHF